MRSILLLCLALSAGCAHRAAPAGPAASAPQHILTILAVSDLAASAAFYQQAFGWPRRVDAPVFVELELPDGRGLGLYQREAFGHNSGQVPDPVPEGAIAGTEIYLHCQQLEAVMARLQAAGARQLSARAPRPWGDEAAYYADLDGNVLVVARPLRGGEAE